MRGDTVLEGLDEARAAARRAARRRASTTTTSPRRSRRKASRSSPTSFDEIVESIRAKRGVAGGCMSATEHRRAHLGARRDALDRGGRGATGSAGSTSRSGCATTSTCCSQFAGLGRRPVDAFVLLGMGGSSLAPEVLRQTFRQETFHVLDTTHPQAIRDLEAQIDIAAHAVHLGVEVGLDARDALAHRLLLGADRRQRRALRRDHRPGLGARASSPASAGSAAIFAGEPTIGGRYSALSPFGMVPAALMGVDVARLLDRALEMAEACRLAEGNPGLELGLSLGEGWRDGRDKICINPSPGGFGLWAEQLIAESTGKHGKGLVPCPGETAPTAPTGRRRRCACPTRTSSGRSSSAGSSRPRSPARSSASTRSTSPTCSRRRTRRTQCSPRASEPDVDAGRLGRGALRAGAGGRLRLHPGVRQPDGRGRGRRCSSSRRGRGRRRAASSRTASGRATCTRPGSCTRAARRRGSILQVVDETGDELAIPGKPFGFGKLIRAQAAGDFASLKERGRRVARIRLEEV